MGHGAIQVSHQSSSNIVNSYLCALCALLYAEADLGQLSERIRIDLQEIRYRILGFVFGNAGDSRIDRQAELGRHGGGAVYAIGCRDIVGVITHERCTGIWIFLKTRVIGGGDDDA